MDVDQAAEVVRAALPRRLRIDELLRELGAQTATTRARPVPTLALGAVVDRAEEAGFGFLIGVLALVAIPFVGLSTPFGLGMALLGGQLVIGRTHPWLPARLRRRLLPLTSLDRVLGLLDRRAHFLARWTRRRAEPLLAGPARRLIGLAILVLGLGLALPLPVPGSNLVFLIPLVVYAIGLLERDGAWIVVGHVLTLIDVALLVAFGEVVMVVLRRLLGWI